MASRATLVAALIWVTATVSADEIGTVATKFRLLTPNDKILVEAFDDDAVPGVACYVSRAKTGGLSGAVGVAEDTSDASIDCRQIGPVRLPEEVRSGKADGEEVFKRRTSLLFKSLQVVRFYDPKRNALVYLAYSDRIIEGSPKNSISAVPILSWPGSVEGPASNQ
ncbi:MAG TPA: CreA family protein [Chromatiaceae bacterium]|nr:CreA family protein [Chromatiaceae bacterium]